MFVQVGSPKKPPESKTTVSCDIDEGVVYYPLPREDYGKWYSEEESVPKVLKKKFYVIKNQDVNIPYTHITFCYLETSQGVAKGVSITSNKDKHISSRGRQIALGRAEKAVRKRCSGDLIKKPEYYKLRRFGIECLSSWIGET